MVLVSLSSSFPGLLLSYKGQKQAFISYTYALTPLSDSPSRVDWKILTAEGLECQHIRYYQLQPGDNLNSLATKYKKLHAVSIVLANTEDSLQLAPEFKESAVKLKKGSLAVILISSEDGRSLREFLNRHDTGELHARIESKNMPQVELQSSIPPGVTYSPSPQPKSGAKHRGQCIYRSIVVVFLRYKLKFCCIYYSFFFFFNIILNIDLNGSFALLGAMISPPLLFVLCAGIRASFRRGTRRLSINLKDEIKQLMFPINGPVCVSEDEGLFKVVMSTFYQHEQMVRGNKSALYGCPGESLKPTHCEPHLNYKACRLRAPQSTFSLIVCIECLTNTNLIKVTFSR